ncbi:putative neural Wiskott-Aldrich syndrome protein [Blattamonas nauphoetae]|uniref:Neural Wiskott-Aldrich syndrome protein n=1 Tax=Blattamonas nauphoetae TaxID=2049346 RepID=A0ABQ9YCD6_9EUKA|nr:putative neural Wiskott-Aldrich syndrome protein [Blattamonas nauphoetae]
MTYLSFTESESENLIDWLEDNLNVDNAFPGGAVKLYEAKNGSWQDTGIVGILFLVGIQRAKYFVILGVNRPIQVYFQHELYIGFMTIPSNKFFHSFEGDGRNFGFLFQKSQECTTFFQELPNFKPKRGFFNRRKRRSPKDTFEIGTPTNLVHTMGVDSTSNQMKSSTIDPEVMDVLKTAGITTQILFDDHQLFNLLASFSERYGPDKEPTPEDVNSIVDQIQRIQTTKLGGAMTSQSSAPSRAAPAPGRDAPGVPPPPPMGPPGSVPPPPKQPPPASNPPSSAPSSAVSDGPPPKPAPASGVESDTRNTFLAGIRGFDATTLKKSAPADKKEVKQPTNKLASSLMNVLQQRRMQIEPDDDSTTSDDDF